MINWSNSLVSTQHETKSSSLIVIIPRIEGGAETK